MLATVLSQNGGKILGPIAELLGKAMNGIYVLLTRAGIENVALTIIIFTICVYMCLLPLTIKQQKFSKMSQIMQPELQAVQKKYKGKRDQVSAQKMQEETQAVYKKYGVSPSGSCIQLVIQLPILFALYRVIYNVPGYINSVKEIFTDSVNAIMATDGFGQTMLNFYESAKEGNYVMKNISVDFASGTAADIPNYIVDVLYRCTTSNWLELQNLFPSAAEALAIAQTKVDEINNFLGVSIVYSPKNVIGTAFHEGQYLLILIGILIPVLSLVTQFLNIRLMPQASSTGDGNSMAGQMKMMNYMMPIYSFILVFFLPVGLGVYWIAGALIRCIQQFIINRYFNKVDMDKLIAKNMEKAKAKEAKKAEKQKKVAGTTIANNASMRTKYMASKASVGNTASSNKKGNETASAPAKQYKQGSLAAKANMVNNYNNKNSKNK